MTVVEEFLVTFDGLSPAEQDLVADQILQRMKHRYPVPADYGALSDEALLEIADEGFQRLDAEEERVGKTKAG